MIRLNTKFERCPCKDCKYFNKNKCIISNKRIPKEELFATECKNYIKKDGKSKI